jgi:branched-chain amino acid transport system permease protein
MTHERLKLQTLIAGVVLAGLAFVPMYAWLTGDMYVLTLFGRILAFSLAALGLNLALGYGGMVSLGHAMYMGLGAYTVGILSSLGVFSGWVHLVCTAFITILIATPLSWVALRTQGIAFIMITLAFAQLFYYVFVSLKMFGGDDGISLKQLSDFGILTGNKFAIYISLLMTLFLSIWVMHKIVASQFGLLLRASKTNNRRVKALGSHTLTYRMTAYVISALLCALAGFFLANLTGFVSPALMAWSISGELIVMVLLGGVGSVFGPIVGALAFLLTEEGLKLLTERWPLILGPLIVLIVIYLKNGLWGLWSKR